MELFFIFKKKEKKFTCIADVWRKCWDKIGKHCTFLRRSAINCHCRNRSRLRYLERSSTARLGHLRHLRHLRRVRSLRLGQNLTAPRVPDEDRPRARQGRTCPALAFVSPTRTLRVRAWPKGPTWPRVSLAPGRYSAPQGMFWCFDVLLFSEAAFGSNRSGIKLRR